MSDETESLLQKYVTDQKVAFPIVRSTRAGSAYGITAFPTFALIGPDGQLVEDMGHGVPSAETIETGLANVTLLPEVPDSRRLESLSKAFEANEFGKVTTELERLRKDADKLGDDERAFVDAVQKMFDARVAATSRRIQKLAAGPDYFEASQALEKIAEQFDGVPVGGEAKAELDRFKKDPAIKKEIHAGQILQRSLDRYDPSSVSQRRRLAKTLETFTRRFEGTQAAKKAAEMLPSLQH